MKPIIVLLSTLFFFTSVQAEESIDQSVFDNMTLSEIYAKSYVLKLNVKSPVRLPPIQNKVPVGDCRLELQTWKTHTRVLKRDVVFHSHKSVGFPRAQDEVITDGDRSIFSLLLPVGSSAKTFGEIKKSCGEAVELEIKRPTLDDFEEASLQEGQETAVL